MFQRRFPACKNISIHAAREGGDKTKEARKNFVAISIHAAREGGDHLLGNDIPEELISIHAAREGGDSGNV